MAGLKWGCVILAGDDGVPLAPGLPPKPLIEFGGRPSVAWVYDAVSHVETVVVGVDGVSQHVGGRFVPQVGGAVDNMKAGLAALGPCDGVLMIPSDSPFLSRTDIDGFCSFIEGRMPGPDWYAIGLCPISTFVTKFPAVPVSGVRTRQGRMASSSLWALSPQTFPRAEAMIRELRESRKSQIGLVRKMGLWNLMRFLTGLTTLQQAEHALTSAAGAPVLLDPNSSPESCLDFDDLADLAALQKLPR